VCTCVCVCVCVCVCECVCVGVLMSLQTKILFLLSRYVLKAPQGSRSTYIENIQ